MTPEEARSTISDALRYTLIIEDPYYTEERKTAVGSLRGRVCIGSIQELLGK